MALAMQESPQEEERTAQWMDERIEKIVPVCSQREQAGQTAGV